MSKTVAEEKAFAKWLEAWTGTIKRNRGLAESSVLLVPPAPRPPKSEKATKTASKAGRRKAPVR